MHTESVVGFLTDRQAPDKILGHCLVAGEQIITAAHCLQRSHLCEQNLQVETRSGKLIRLARWSAYLCTESDGLLFSRDCAWTPAALSPWLGPVPSNEQARITVFHDRRRLGPAWQDHNVELSALLRLGEYAYDLPLADKAVRLVGRELIQFPLRSEPGWSGSPLRDLASGRTMGFLHGIIRGSEKHVSSLAFPATHLVSARWYRLPA